jgi:hypothetical protein
VEETVFKKRGSLRRQCIRVNVNRLLNPAEKGTHTGSSADSPTGYPASAQTEPIKRFRFSRRDLIGFVFSAE